MSAFCGVVDLSGRDLPPSARDRVGLAPLHVGLERPRIWLGQYAAFGHAQTHITFEDRIERQPTGSRGGHAVILFNGHLFDHRGLCHALGMDAAASSGDSVLAAACVDRYGPEAADRMPGDYAFARLNLDDRRLDLVLSPMTPRQIYWHRSGSVVTFATTLSALFAFPHVPRRLDPVALAEDLVASFHDECQTVYQDIYRIQQGTGLTLSERGETPYTLWRPDPARRVTFKRDQDYVDRARELLEQAVARCLRSATPPGAMLTGGLDSSAVATTASRQMADTLRCYTAVPPPDFVAAPGPGRYSDEREAVGAIAAMHPGLDVSFHHSTGPAAIEEAQSALFLMAGRPLPALSNLGWFHPLHRVMAQNGHRVVLGGQIGNMTLSYDGRRSLADLLRGGEWGVVRGDYAAAMRPNGGTLIQAMKREVLYPAMPSFLRYRISASRAGQRPWQKASALSPDFAAAIRLEERLADAPHDGTYVHEADSRAMRAKFLRHYGHFWGEAMQAMGGYHGLEIRDPLADRDLVDFCLAIPVRLYVAGGQFRSFARRVLADRLPPAIVTNDKVGEQCPEWFARQSAQRQSYAETLADLKTSPLASELLDLPRLERLVAEWPKEREDVQDTFGYRHLIARAVHTGRFIGWVEGGNG